MRNAQDETLEHNRLLMKLNLYAPHMSPGTAGAHGHGRIILDPHLLAPAHPQARPAQIPSARPTGLKGSPPGG